jgi:hypothetical protein
MFLGDKSCVGGAVLPYLLRKHPYVLHSLHARRPFDPDHLTGHACSTGDPVLTSVFLIVCVCGGGGATLRLKTMSDVRSVLAIVVAW